MSGSLERVKICTKPIFDGLYGSSKLFTFIWSTTFHWRIINLMKKKNNILFKQAGTKKCLSQNCREMMWMAFVTSAVENFFFEFCKKHRIRNRLCRLVVKFYQMRLKMILKNIFIFQWIGGSFEGQGHFGLGALWVIHPSL